MATLRTFTATERLRLDRHRAVRVPLPGVLVDGHIALRWLGAEDESAVLTVYRSSRGVRTAIGAGFTLSAAAASGTIEAASAEGIRELEIVVTTLAGTAHTYADLEIVCTVSDPE